MSSTTLSTFVTPLLLVQQQQKKQNAKSIELDRVRTTAEE